MNLLNPPLGLIHWDKWIYSKFSENTWWIKDMIFFTLLVKLSLYPKQFVTNYYEKFI